jgi:hypothetical protein
MSASTTIRIMTFAGCAIGAVGCIMSRDWTELLWIALTAWWAFDATTQKRQPLADQPE